MKKNIKFINITSTPAIEEYVNKKVDALDKFIDPNDTSVFCDVEIGKISRHHKTADVFKAELNLHIAGLYLNAKEESEDLYASIDIVKDEMEREIISRKERKTTLIRKGASKIKDLIKGIGRFGRK